MVQRLLLGRARLANPIQRQAALAGWIVAPKACALTGFSKPSDPKGSGYIFMHNEDYNRPLEFYAISRSAHHALHSRFTNPLPWLRLVNKHYRHGAWFTFLTLDPEDMRRPFDEVYPIGLPREGELWTDVADEMALSPLDYPANTGAAELIGVTARNLFR